MARSHKHTPIIGVCTYGAGAMRAFRKLTARRLRAATRKALRGDFDAMTDPRQPEAVMERWDAPDDGRTYLSPTTPDRTKLLRK